VATPRYKETFRASDSRVGIPQATQSTQVLYESRAAAAAIHSIRNSLGFLAVLMESGLR